MAESQSKGLFSQYDLHYQRMKNALPDWEGAAENPARFAFKAPWLPPSTSARILDLGCGWGNHLMGLWAAGYRNLEGVELVQDQAAIARQAAAGRVEIHCADGLDYLRAKPNSYDLILMSDVIEHIEPKNIPDVLRAIHCSLRVGGTLTIRTPNMASILASYSRHMDVTHVTGFTEFSLVQLLNQTGFVNHCIVPERVGQPSAWRFWAPWRGLGLRGLANIMVHRFLYWIRTQDPRPTQFGYNLEIFTHRGE